MFLMTLYFKKNKRRCSFIHDVKVIRFYTHSECEHHVHLIMVMRALVSG